MVIEKLNRMIAQGDLEPPACFDAVDEWFQELSDADNRDGVELLGYYELTVEEVQEAKDAIYAWMEDQCCAGCLGCN